MALSEIEKLERRYAENPQGLTFAPLAEVHRKNGEVQRALDLLGPGLAIHPDYIPASIVLGRCHLDLGDVHAAETAFLHVLSLDGENVIALKALADISERLLKFDDAERWLHTLLSVDRSNDEAREQLQRVEIAKRQAGVASSAEPDSVREPETPELVEPSAPERTASPEPAAASEPVVAVQEPTPPPYEPAEYEPPVAEPAAGWLEPSAIREPLDDPAGIQLDEPSRLEPEVPPLDGLVGREVDVPDAAADDFRVETSEDIVLRSAGGSEFQVPDASQELFAGGAQGHRAPFEEEPPAPPASESRPEPEPRPAYEPEPEPAPMVEPAPVAERFEPEPVAAELVSPEPPAAEPAAPEPVAPEPVEPEPVVARAAATPPAAPRRAYAASDTGGRPVAQVLQDILAARPPSQSAAPAVRQAPSESGTGAPTRPAADALSLSSVFGEESPGTPPAVPAPGSGSGVSFDDFFGASGAAPTQRTTRAPDSKNDDLDQFHAWLQNLKR